MKITRRQLRRLLSESLLVEASAEELAKMKGTYSINPVSAQALGFAARNGEQIRVGPRGNVNVGDKDGNFIRSLKPSEVTPEQLKYITTKYNKKAEANEATMAEMSDYFRKKSGYYKVDAGVEGVPSNATHIQITANAKYRYYNFNENPEKLISSGSITPKFFSGWK
jgi:hypothetical protein